MAQTYLYLIGSAKEACIVIFVLAFVLRSMHVHAENLLVIYNISYVLLINTFGPVG